MLDTPSPPNSEPSPPITRTGVVRPLKPPAIAALRRLHDAPVPCNELNPGIRDRLSREKLAEFVDLPSPFKTRKGLVPHMRITASGVIALQALPRTRG